MVRWQSVDFPNGRGVSLAGLLARPVEDSGRVVVMCHGFTGSHLGGGAADLAGELARHGWAALAFDFAGCGESEGDFADVTLSGQIGDVGAAVDWCVAHGFSRVVTLGRSFGGTTVVCHAAGDRRVGAVATLAAVARPLDLFAGFAGGPVNPGGDPEAPVPLAGAAVKKKFFADLTRWDVPACASRLAPRPFLILHGTADEVVPPREAELLHAAAGEPKEMVLIQDADHRFTGCLDKTRGAFLAWLERL